MTDITKPKENTKDFIMNHDAFIRRSMTRKKVAVEFFEANLPKHILKEVDLTTLKLEKSDFVDTTLGKGIVDLLFSVKWGRENGYLSILFEAQSTVDKQMPFRIVKYMLRICDLHLTQNKNAKFPVIYPLVLYTGAKPYTAPRSFWEMFTKPALARQFFTDPFYVLSLRDIENIDVRNRYHSGVVLHIMKEIWGEDILPHLEPIRELLGELDLHLTEDVLRYILDTGKSKDDESVLQFFMENVPEQYKEKFMTIREQIEKKGIEKRTGFIVNNMLKKNLEVKEISSMTGLRVSEIKKFLKKKEV